jgi:hypothetical protein
MHWTEILTIILIISYLVGMIIYFAVRKSKGQSMEELTCPFAPFGGEKLKKQFAKAKRIEAKQRHRSKIH